MSFLTSSSRAASAKKRGWTPRYLAMISKWVAVVTGVQGVGGVAGEDVLLLSAKAEHMFKNGMADFQEFIIMGPSGLASKGDFAQQCATVAKVASPCSDHFL